MLNGLDLFSGYGGAADCFRGISRVVAYCEIEPGAQDILLSRMWRNEVDRAPISDDVRGLRRQDILEDIDLVTAGWPCQDLSIAGPRGGMDGIKSGLFFEVERLVCEFRPAFVFLENVPNALRLGFGRVGGALAKLRYDCRWGLLSAHDMGAPHLRERMWLLAANTDIVGQRRLQPEPVKWGCKEIRDHRAYSKQVIADYFELGRRKGLPSQMPWQWGADAVCGASEWLTRDIPEPSLLRGHDGLFRWRDRYRALGNGWVPQAAREAFRRLMWGL